MRKTPTAVFFYGGIYSQWAPTPIVEGNLTFPTAEHRMMYYKAKTFLDEEAMEAILKTNCPREAKKIGRRVKCFVPSVWESVNDQIVEDTSYLKAKQHSAMMNEFIFDCDRELVEASPYDKIWGIGLPAYDPRCTDRTKWEGQNKLGRALMRARDRIFKEDQYSGKWLREVDIYK